MIIVILRAFVYYILLFVRHACTRTQIHTITILHVRRHATIVIYFTRTHTHKHTCVYTCIIVFRRMHSCLNINKTNIRWLLVQPVVQFVIAVQLFRRYFDSCSTQTTTSCWSYRKDTVRSVVTRLTTSDITSDSDDHGSSTAGVQWQICVVTLSLQHTCVDTCCLRRLQATRSRLTASVLV